MSQSSDHGAPAPEVLDVGGRGDAPADGGSSGVRRGLLIGGGVLAVGLVGAAVAVAAGRLGGGGAQPDEAVPASAFAFVAVDLDPSAGQKLDALRFARKFPGARAALKTDDLRQGLFESLKKKGTVRGDWATDVAPWLGQRAGVAVLPPVADGEDPGVVVVLAVSDRAKAKAGLAKVAGGDAACELTDAFAVCAQDAATAKKAVAHAAKSPLSAAADYTKDLDALGDRGIARWWMDLSKTGDAVPSSGLTGLSAFKPELKGRLAFALRFDGPTLALTGNVVGSSSPRLSGSASVDDLPSDTLAAYGVGGADSLIGNGYDLVRAAVAKQNGTADLDAQLQQLQQDYGISVPKDIQRAVGPRVAVLFGGLTDGTPKVAVRLSGDRGVIDRLAAAVQESGGPPIAKAAAGSDTVLASSQAYADAVTRGRGLGSQKAFTDAVPASKDAQAVLYVNVAGVLGQLSDQMGLTAEARANLAPLASFGMSLRQDGDRLAYEMRLTTK